MEETTPATEYIDIDPKGDVIFVCNEVTAIPGRKTEVKEFRIRASSAVLMAMSSVFASMLGPHFKEGYMLRANSTVEIALPDDHPRGLIMLLNILHLKSSCIPQTLDPFRLVSVAVLADKYLCIERIGFAARVWVKSYEGQKGDVTAGMLMSACFHLRMADEFGHYSRALVMRSRESKNIQDRKYLHGVDPGQKRGFARAFSILEQYKNDRFGDIRLCIESTISRFVCARGKYPGNKCLASCHAAQFGLFELMLLLRTNGIDPECLRQSTLEAALEGLENMPDFPYSAQIRPCSSQCIYHRLYDETRRYTFKQIAKDNTPPPTLLCLEGQHSIGNGKEYSYQCGVGCCKHCNFQGFQCTH